MLVRIVDYVANPGGGVRFTAEMLGALLRATAHRFEIVSSGLAMARYRDLIPRDDRVGFLEIAPDNAWRTRTLMPGIPGAGPLNWLLRMPSFHFDVPASVLGDCDQLWFPWLHRHRIPWRFSDRVVATLHDLISVEFRGIVPPFQRRDERETVRAWLASSARVVATSHATVARLTDLFGAAPGRVGVIPLSGSHARGPRARATAAFAFEERPYLLAPINLTPHKNYEVLLAGVGRWGARHPLVVTGSHTDIWSGRSLRTLRLRRLAAAAGLAQRKQLFALGYVDDATYYALLDRAWALVMPTLAEGGGSFPVWEALLSGVPVLCADIPVMREMVERIGGGVTWFDPRSAEDLARRLSEVDGDYPRIKALAVGQVGALRRRTWDDVAAEYAGVLGGPAPGSPGGRPAAEAPRPSRP